MDAKPIIRYESSKIIAPAQLLTLYNDLGWTNYTRDPEALAAAVANSWQVISAWDGYSLVGLIRAVGDGVSVALIQDLLVRKSHQKLGIGSVLLGRILALCADIRQIILLTDAGEANLPTLAWYHKRGFKTVAELQCSALAIFHMNPSTEPACPSFR